MMIKTTDSPYSGLTKLNGTNGVTISTPAVRYNSWIFLEHYNLTSDINPKSLGILGSGNIKDQGSFEIFSNNPDDYSEVCWWVVNHG